jgi:hypothetical protein
MIEPKEIEIDGKKFIISKFPAVAGREIIAKYIPSIMPKVGDYKVNEETMLKMMKYVGVVIDNSAIPIILSTQALIDNHVKNWEMLGKLEIALMEYNCSFFQSGRISTFLTDIAQKVPGWTIKMLTVLSAQLSKVEKPPSVN